MSDLGIYGAYGGAYGSYGSREAVEAAFEEAASSGGGDGGSNDTPAPFPQSNRNPMPFNPESAGLHSYLLNVWRFSSEKFTQEGPPESTNWRNLIAATYYSIPGVVTSGIAVKDAKKRIASAGKTLRSITYPFSPKPSLSENTKIAVYEVDKQEGIGGTQKPYFWLDPTQVTHWLKENEPLDPRLPGAVTGGLKIIGETAREGIKSVGAAALDEYNPVKQSTDFLAAINPLASPEGGGNFLTENLGLVLIIGGVILLALLVK